MPVHSIILIVGSLEAFGFKRWKVAGSKLAMYVCVRKQQRQTNVDERRGERAEPERAMKIQGVYPDY